MNFESLYQKAIALEPLTADEGLLLYRDAPLTELMLAADTIRRKLHPENWVTWIIDRNVNITNICISGCKFCNFHRKINGDGTYTTTFEDYRSKIIQMIELGGNQLLLQGGMHPGYGLSFYTKLFSQLKEEFPTVKLHALGPPEIVHIARKERKGYREILEALVASGLDSLPGAGAEILCDRVRRSLSPGKALTDQWLDVMREAHKMNLVTSATMMFGHIETIDERIDHLVHGIGGHAGGADRDMGDIEAQFLGARGDGGEFRLVRALVIRTVADDGFETHCLDRIEILDGDLSAHRVFIVDLANIHGKALSRKMSALM